MSLNNSISQPLSTSVQEHIIKELWASPGQHTIKPYFYYYTDQCRTALHASSNNLTIKTHQQVLDLAEIISSGCSREEVSTKLATRTSGSNAYLDLSIDLTTRLLLMLDVGEFRNAFSGRKPLLWLDGSIKDFVHDLFRPYDQMLPHDGIKLNNLFTARNMDRVAGFKVEFTNNLADHLRFADNKTVSIFYHASFLQLQETNQIFPEGFIQETLQTLALLFPSDDHAGQKWYARKVDSEDLDPRLFKCGSRSNTLHRQITGYRYWHDRLVILKEEFDDSRPTTFLQWWNDRRDGIQWYTLWLAIALTLFFGAVQSIEGALQVYKAYHPTSGGL